MFHAPPRSLWPVREAITSAVCLMVSTNRYIPCVLIEHDASRVVVVGAGASPDVSPRTGAPGECSESAHQKER
ncbi:hypothetical protein E2C01_102154 [Portunus trituberculatus]|uniref:Uncharacterized protein n=1 Tax=Portunus trituberculatus TaxID=210409 RepID=A0A5B7KHT6_PORTR|nr:hypothetical protein [Portunus trituberculatus]